MRHFGALQLACFAVGLGFFGWFWTRGGQTLGMRAWNLRVQRPDGSAVRWPIATLRFGVLLLTWMCVLGPLFLSIPVVAQRPHAVEAGIAMIALSVLSLGGMMLDPQRRAPCDFASGTLVVRLPQNKKGKPG